MKAALVGNPNAGKTSVFNLLTGLNQKVGNYPGITVDKKWGHFNHQGTDVELLDLPGLYSIYPKSQDEEVVFQVLRQKDHRDHPDLVIVVMDATNLERNLFLATQILDLGIPTLLIANMIDLMDKDQVGVNFEKLSELLGGVPLVPFNARTGQDLALLKSALLEVPLEVMPSPAHAGIYESGGLEYRQARGGCPGRSALQKNTSNIVFLSTLTSKAVGKTSKMGSNPYPSCMGLPHFSLSFGPHLSNHFCLV